MEGGILVIKYCYHTVCVYTYLCSIVNDIVIMNVCGKGIESIQLTIATVSISDSPQTGGNIM